MSAFTKTIAKLLGVLGFEMHKKGYLHQRSFVDALKHACDLGLPPATVLDVGAAYGAFTLNCYNIFPKSRYILIEPLNEYKKYLERVCQTVPNSQYVLAAASSTKGQLTINVHPDLVGSSIFLEQEDSNVNGLPRTVPAETLDHVCEEMKASGPYLIKIDVQGAELEVLSGAKGILHEAEYIVLEVSLFKFFVDGPQIHDVVQYMKSCGFSVYDIFDLQYRPLDKSLSQMDMAFVRDNGQFRKHHFYATREQRQEQTERILKSKV
jgi:FkbM family methyltransferase